MLPFKLTADIKQKEAVPSWFPMVAHPSLWQASVCCLAFCPALPCTLSRCRHLKGTSRELGLHPQVWCCPPACPSVLCQRAARCLRRRHT